MNTISSVSPMMTMPGLAVSATNRFTSGMEQVAAEAQQPVVPSSQAVVESDTERPVEGATAPEPQELSTTTQDALRSRQLQGIEIGAALNGGGRLQESSDAETAEAATGTESPAVSSAVEQAANNRSRELPYSGAINQDGVPATEGGSTIDVTG